MSFLETHAFSFSRRVLGSHTREDILPGTQADKQRKGDEPDTQAEVRGNLCEGGLVIDGRRIPIPPGARDAAVSDGGAEMLEPQPVVDDDEGTTRQEKGVRQLDDGEVAQVDGVDGVARDAQQRQVPWEAVDEPQEHLHRYNHPDESLKEFGAEDRVFLHQFRQVVETRRDRECEEAEA